MLFTATVRLPTLSRYPSALQLYRQAWQETQSVAGCITVPRSVTLRVNAAVRASSATIADRRKYLGLRTAARFLLAGLLFAIGTGNIAE